MGTSSFLPVADRTRHRPIAVKGATVGPDESSCRTTVSVGHVLVSGVRPSPLNGRTAVLSCQISSLVVFHVSVFRSNGNTLNWSQLKR